VTLDEVNQKNMVEEELEHEDRKVTGETITNFKDGLL
jgi:hypothetical protein